MKHNEIEDKISEFWRNNDIYRKSKENMRDGQKWYWLDGPPYATGSIHVGTAMNKVIKDFYLRVYRMLGYNVWSQPGYDTHGVPIENKVEKMLGFKSKQDIEEFGVEKFINECEKFATKFVGVMGEQFINLGVWMDWDNPYMTLDNDYIEGVWFTFKKAFEKGLLYRGTYAVHVCPGCETAVAYNEIEYKEVEDTSIFVKFKVNGKKNEYLVIWTTTPWTLPSNTGVMVNPKEDYVRIGIGKDVLIIGKPLVEKLMEKFNIDKYKVLDTFKGKELEGLEYENPLSDTFKFQKHLNGAHRIVLSEQFVNMEEGTGLVHTAPGHGQEDYKVGMETGLPILNPLKMDGKFGEGSGEYEGIFAKDADRMIIDELKKKGYLLREEKIRHDYPFCWRCNSPLLMMAVPQWFFKVTEIRENLLEENKKINWVPEWAGQRFRNWLENLGDWPISRQRYWGTPLPIWICGKCEKIKVVGSRDELPYVPEDFHKPHIDEVKFDCECGGEMRRVPDVLDVWFDAGVAGWASLGYPSKKKPFEDLWPVDFVLEGPDQIRGWWNSSMITSIMTFGRRAFNNVLFHGFVLDAHGTKMSKSKGNIVTTEEAIEKYGRDVLRFYYLSRPVWDDTYFKLEDMDELSKQFMVVRNVFNFIKTYVPEVPKTKPKRMKPEDKWILSRLNKLVCSSTDYCKGFISHKAANDIMDFIVNDFSRWYIKIIRDRVWPEYYGADKKAAYYTLFEVTDTLSKLLAPFCPYLSEAVYQDIILPLSSDKRKESIHMETWPVADEKLIDENLNSEMDIVKQIVESSYSARHTADIKLRWPVSDIFIVSNKKEVSSSVKNLNAILTNMCNSKIVSVKQKRPEGEFSESDSPVGTVLVSTEMNDELLNEALFREIIRKIQSMRKKAGMEVSDKIKLHINSDDETENMIKENEGELSKEVGASSIEFDESDKENKADLEFKSIKIQISFNQC